MPIGQKTAINKQVPMTAMGSRLHEFAPHFKEECFLAWYEAGKPVGVALIKSLPKDEDGNRPSVAAFHEWRKAFGWDERAREMDAEVQKRVSELAIEKKVEMFKRHAEAARVLQERGLEYLMNSKNEIGNASTALRLVVEGAKLERVSTGVGQAMDQFAQMSDKSLKSVITKLLAGAGDDLDLPDGVVEGVISEVPDNDVEEDSPTD